MDNINNWYVYKHTRLDLNVVFYIGIGKKSNFKRAYDINNRNIVWKKIFNKTNIAIDILFTQLTKEEASKKEQELIKYYGRKDLNSGTLCNLTDGGDGIWNCVRSNETRIKLSISKVGNKNPMYGKQQSNETLIKRSISLTGKKRSEDTKIKQSLSSIVSGQAKLTKVINFKTNEEIGIYHSMSEACRNVGLNPIKYSSKASLVANGFRKQTMGFIFKYI